METRLEHRGSVTVVPVGRIDFTTNTAFERALAEALDAGARRLVVDFGSVDSSAAREFAPSSPFRDDSPPTRAFSRCAASLNRCDRCWTSRGCCRCSRPSLRSKRPWPGSPAPTRPRGFGEYFGVFVPFFATRNVLFSLPLGPVTWTLNGGQLAGAMAIIGLTAVNYVGLKQGAVVQNVVTLAKIGSLVGLGVLGMFAASDVSPQLLRPLPQAGLFSALGVGMVAVFWSFDGFYAVTNLARLLASPDPGQRPLARAFHDRIRLFADVVEAVHLSAAPDLRIELDGDARELQSFRIQMVANAPGAVTPWGTLYPHPIKGQGIYCY